MKKLILLSLLIACYSCSNDDDDVDTSNLEEENIQLSNFSIISEDDEAFYEYQFKEASQDAFEINLTTQEGISRQSFLVHRNESIFGFYGQGNALIKDFKTEQLRFVDDFGGQAGEERLSTRNDDQTLAILYSLVNTNQFFVRVIDVLSTMQFEIPLGELSLNSSLFVQGDDVFIVHNDGNQSSLFRVSKSAQTLVEQITIDAVTSGLVFSDANSILLFDFSGSYREYSLDDLHMIATGTSSFVPDNSVTFKYRDGVIYSQFQYPQPNFFSIGPAAYNLEATSESIIDVATIFNEYLSINEDTLSIQPVHFDFDTENDVWIVAFQAQDDLNISRFGYFIINQAGDILSEASLERLPWTVIVHN